MRTILVVANETLGGRALIEAVRSRVAEGDVRFVLCVPQNRPRAGLVVYDDAVHDAAQARVDLALGFVLEVEGRGGAENQTIGGLHGIEQLGTNGGAEPFQAGVADGMLFERQVELETLGGRPQHR